MMMSGPCKELEVPSSEILVFFQRWIMLLITFHRLPKLLRCHSACCGAISTISGGSSCISRGRSTVKRPGICHWLVMCRDMIIMIILGSTILFEITFCPTHHLFFCRWFISPQNVALIKQQECLDCAAMS
jgi:hypothetical protein